MKQDPLSLVKFKKVLARLAIAVATDPDSSDRQKRQAIIVLRTASKEHFAKAFHHLFAALVSSERAVAQLLYCAFTYLERDFPVVEGLRPLVDAMSKCSEVLARTEAESGVRASIGLTLKTLEHHGRYLLQGAPQLTPAQAWRRLLAEFGSMYHIHHPICEAADALRLKLLEPLIEDVTHPLPKTKKDWSKTRSDWDDKCVPFIFEVVRPLLRIIRNVIGGLDAKLIAGSTAVSDSLDSLAGGKPLTEAATVSLALEEFARDEANLRRPGLWREYVQARDRIWDLLLNPGEIPSRRGASVLIRLIQRCPADLRSVLPDQISKLQLEPEAQMEWLTEDDAVLAFCHETVVRDTISEFLKNALKHCDHVTAIKVIVVPSEDHVTVEVSNDGRLQPSDMPGRGLQLCSERLRPYGARLIRKPPTSPWTFEVAVQFSKG